MNEEERILERTQDARLHMDRKGIMEKAVLILRPEECTALLAR